MKTIVLVLFFTMQVAFARGAWADSYSQQYQVALHAYQEGDYRKTIELLSPLLYPTIYLAQKERVFHAHKLLGISYVFLKKTEAAEKEFMAILAIQPDYRLDPLVDPLAAVEFFESVKQRNAEVLRNVLEREEAEARRVEQLRKREQKAKKGPIAERVIIKNRYWINYVPFGMGQFQNGHYKKGFSLMGTQLGLGAISIASYIWLRFAYPQGIVPESEFDRARAINIMQVASGILFFTALAYGVIDALNSYQPTTVFERKYYRNKKSNKTNTSLSSSGHFVFVPVVGPNSGGLSLYVMF